MHWLPDHRYQRDEGQGLCGKCRQNTTRLPPGNPSAQQRGTTPVAQCQQPTGIAVEAQPGQRMQEMIEREVEWTVYTAYAIVQATLGAVGT